MGKEITIKDYDNQNDWIRLCAYEKFGFIPKAFKEKNWQIRLDAYRKLGFTEQALNDQSWQIRINAYKKLGIRYKERLLLCERKKPGFIKEILNHWKNNEK